MKIRKISTKIWAGFLAVLLIMAFIACYSYIQLDSLNNKVKELRDRRIRNMLATESLALNTARQSAAIRGFLASGDAAFLSDLTSATAVVEAKMNYLSSNAQNKEKLMPVKEAVSNYTPYPQKVVAVYKESGQKAAVEYLASVAAPFAAKLAEALDTYIKYQEGTMESDANRIISIESHLKTVIVLLFVIAAILSLGIAYYISRIISKPVIEVTNAADRLALGDVNVSVETKSVDEIGRLVQSFNIMADNIRSNANIAHKIAAGDLSVDVKVKSDNDVMSKSMKLVIDTLSSLIGEMDHMSSQHDAGDIDVLVSDDQYQGVYKKMAQGINNMVQGHISVKRKAMACIAEFAKGNFNAELEKFPGKKAFINDNIEGLRKNLKNVNAEIHKLITASHEGHLSQRGNSEAFQGDWSELMKGLNGLIDAIVEPVQEAADVLEEMSKGNLRVSVKGSYKGDHAKIKNALNDTIKTLFMYVNEISDVLNEMSNGNLNVEINSDYRGDFVAIKKSLNHIIREFNNVLNDIHSAAQQVAAGSKQVSDSAQALSQGSTEQASSMEELSASIEEIASQTQHNAKNASEANELALSAKNDAVDGNEQMKEMLRSMNEINVASTNISKIIKVIDEIAFQTNILALNAAVEAARAGQHGKGFAVVAEEVRNLAARSASAAKETTTLIEGSIRKVGTGTEIATKTASALDKIVEGVSKAAALVGDIAVASNEQANGIAQINQGIMQVSQVIQLNSATSEEGAAASEELSSQSEMLNEMVGKFNLRKTEKQMA